MVTIIIKNSRTSCRSARRWLDNHDINYEEINISHQPFNLTRDILIQILSLEELSLEFALSFLQNNMELLCTPIIFDEKRVQ